MTPNPWFARFVKRATLFAAAAAYVLHAESTFAQDISPSATPEQLASAIARTMAATNPAALSRNGITQEITSHGNVVENRVTFRTAEAFRKMAAHRSDSQAVFTRYLCEGGRLPYLQKGVVFHSVDVGPGPSDTFDFIVDARACASQPIRAEADSESKKVEAQNVANRLTAALSSDPTISGLHLEGVSAADGTVRVAYTVTSPAWIDHLKNRDYEVRGISQGWMCGKLGSAIRKGVRIEVVYETSDGSPLLAFAVDGSTC